MRTIVKFANLFALHILPNTNEYFPAWLRNYSWTIHIHGNPTSYTEIDFFRIEDHNTRTFLCIMYPKTPQSWVIKVLISSKCNMFCQFKGH